MTDLRSHIANLLTAAERGHGLDDEDFARLPNVIADALRTATNRVVAFAASGDQIAARNERRSALDDITNTMISAGYDPAATLPRDPAARQAIRDAVQGPPSEIRTMIEGLPR